LGSASRPSSAAGSLTTRRWQRQLPSNAGRRVGERVDEQPQPGIVHVAFGTRTAARRLHGAFQLADAGPQPPGLGLPGVLGSLRATDCIIRGRLSLVTRPLDGAQLTGAGAQLLAQVGELCLRRTRRARNRSPPLRHFGTQPPFELVDTGAQLRDLGGAGLAAHALGRMALIRLRDDTLPVGRPQQVGDDGGVDRVGRRRGLPATDSRGEFRQRVGDRLSNPGPEGVVRVQHGSELRASQACPLRRGEASERPQGGRELLRRQPADQVRGDRDQLLAGRLIQHNMVVPALLTGHAARLRRGVSRALSRFRQTLDLPSRA
jgi:hypothetical protein